MSTFIGCKLYYPSIFSKRKRDRFGKINFAEIRRCFLSILRDEDPFVLADTLPTLLDDRFNL